VRPLIFFAFFWASVCFVGVSCAAVAAAAAAVAAAAAAAVDAA
jgi:hypothetical protein